MPCNFLSLVHVLYLPFKMCSSIVIAVKTSAHCAVQGRFKTSFSMEVLLVDIVIAAFKFNFGHFVGLVAAIVVLVIVA